MYNLKHHKENNPEEVNEFLTRYPFAFISGCDAQNKPIATQIPVLIEEREGKKILSGHFMKNTDHHKAFLHNSNVLAVFTGHHTYVSGTWYSNPYTASTWNYMSVHIKGTIRFMNDEELEQLIQKTSLHFENNNSQSTTVYNNLPAEFRQWAIKAIVGFEIVVDELDTVFKLSQDRDLKSYHNIIEKLRQQNESGQVIATEMEKRTKQVFP